MHANQELQHVFRVLGGQSAQIGISPVIAEPHNGIPAIAARSQQRFVLLPSRKATRWIIPVGNPRCTASALDIYSPNRRSAVWLKTVLVGLVKLGWKGFSRDNIALPFSQPLVIEALVREISGEAQPVFSFSLGTPGRFRKLTAQVMRPNGEVLGYIKLPLTPEAAERLQNEAAALELLQQFPGVRPHVPRLLFAGDWKGEYILFQSGGPVQVAPVEFGPHHNQFLSEIAKIKPIERPGKALVDEVWLQWKRVEPKLDSNWRALGTAALQKAARELEGITVTCGISHGDFAPWNTRINGHGLYVFDWERAEFQAPLTWDAFHYHVQTSHLLKRRNLQRLLSDRRNAPRASCLLYLVNSVCISIEEIDARNNLALDYRRGILLALLSL